MCAVTGGDERSPLKRDALKIVLIYVVVGGLWILLSDRIVAALVSNERAFTNIATIKGWLFILLTGWMLYALIRRSTRALQRSEEALLENERHFLRRYAAISAGVVVQNQDGVITHANKAAREMLNLSVDEVLERTSYDPSWQAIRADNTPLSRDEHPSIITLRTGKPVRGVVMGVSAREPGKLRWILVNSEPIFCGDGSCMKEVVTTFSDITERKTIFEALRASEARTRALVESIPFDIWACGADGRVQCAEQDGPGTLGRPYRASA